MAQVTITAIPDLVTVGDTNDNELIINHPLSTEGDDVIVIEVKTGTFKFNVGVPASQSNLVLAADDKIVITLPSRMNLHYKAETTGTFVISI